MATGADMVNGALRLLGVKPADDSVTGQEMLDGIEVLNDMLMSWESSGRTLGFSPISDSADELRIPAGTEIGVKSNLAAFLAPEYGKQITPTLAAAINVATNTMLSIINGPITMSFPDTLPFGSGNYHADYQNDHFFPDDEKENF